MKYKRLLAFDMEDFCCNVYTKNTIIVSTLQHTPIKILNITDCDMIPYSNKRFVSLKVIIPGTKHMTTVLHVEEKDFPIMLLEDKNAIQTT